jgi:hypothetical protein
MARRYVCDDQGRRFHRAALAHAMTACSVDPAGPSLRRQSRTDRDTLSVVLRQMPLKPA